MYLLIIYYVTTLFSIADLHFTLLKFYSVSIITSTQTISLNPFVDNRVPGCPLVHIR